MAKKLVIHTATRIIRCVTTWDQPEISIGESVITVPDDYLLSSNNWKLEVDNLTVVEPTAQEKLDYDNFLYPDKAIIKNLRQKALDLFNSTNNAELKAFLVALRDWIKDVS